MGSVWHAQHLTLRSDVAVKLMDPAIALSATGLQRFLREARAAASIRSPHVVQILDHGVDEGTPYIVMEMLEGESLAARLERVGNLTSLEATRIITHVARALTRAHQAGFVHRDLKPDNIFLIQNDDEEIAKVLDFGIAKVKEEKLGWSHNETTHKGAFLGTPYYMSPEQAEGLSSVDYRTDIWSLGVLAFELLVGKRPFDAPTLPTLLLAICNKAPPVPSQCSAVPVGFDAWFATACARDPEARFASAKDAGSSFARLCKPRLELLANPDLERNDASDEALTIATNQLLAERPPPADTRSNDPMYLSSDPRIQSKSGFSATAKDEPVRARPLLPLRLMLLMAATAAGALWFLLPPQERSAAPVEPRAPSVAATSPPPAQPSIANPILPPQSNTRDNVPTIDVNLLPISTEPATVRPSPKLTATIAPSAQPAAPRPSARPANASFGDAPAKPTSDVDLRNPYR